MMSKSSCRYTFDIHLPGNSGKIRQESGPRKDDRVLGQVSLALHVHDEYMALTFPTTTPHRRKNK